MEEAKTERGGDSFRLMMVFVPSRNMSWKLKSVDVFIRDLSKVWARKGYRLDSDRAAGEWAQLCRQLVCVGSSAGN